VIVKVCDSDRSWLALGIAPGTNLDRDRPVPWSPDSLGQLVNAPEVHGVAVINPRLRAGFAASAPNLLRDFDFSVPTMVVLLSRSPLPKISASQGEPVFSFICSAGILRSFLAIAPGIPLEQLCFSLLHSIMNGLLTVERIFVRQLPYWGKIVLSRGHGEPAGVIMAHRGNKNHLQAALHFIHKADGEQPRVRVGLDVDKPEDFSSLVDQYAETEFYYTQPAPVGPYAIRQELSARTAEPLLILHDSDDISCYDRFTTLRAELRYAGRDVMVGSHELMVDEMIRQVSPIRYPLDVSNALKKAAGFAFLHATAIVPRSGFFSAGGLSTDRTIAYDTQFLLRAHFKLRIANVDEFLYIRRRHQESLTVAPETADGIPLRRQVGEMWRADFDAIKRGTLTLEKSSLRPTLRPPDFAFRRLLPGVASASSQ
jgi:hypothetical protein